MQIAYLKFSAQFEQLKTFEFSISESIQRPLNTPGKNSSIEDSVTVIAIYFELNKSKHTVEAYDGWIQNMIAQPSSILSTIYGVT
jgi:hypothetical protein